VQRIAWVVLAETDDANQLSGTSSNNASSENLPEGCLRSISAPTAGQCHSSSLHQQHGWHSVKPADRSGEGTMDVGTQQGYHPDSPTHPRIVKHYRKHGITDSP